MRISFCMLEYRDEFPSNAQEGTLEMERRNIKERLKRQSSCKTQK